MSDRKKTYGQSAGRGFLQGSTFGFSDELGGGTQAGLQLIKSLLEGKSFKDSKDAAGEMYGEAAKGERLEDKLAEESHPNVYAASEFAGGMVPGLATGGAGAGANAARAASQSALRKLAVTGGAGALNSIGHGDGNNMVRDGILGAASNIAGQKLMSKISSKLMPKVAEKIADTVPTPGRQTRVDSLFTPTPGSKMVNEVVEPHITLSREELEKLSLSQINKLLGRGAKAMQDLGE